LVVGVAFGVEATGGAGCSSGHAAQLTPPAVNKTTVDTIATLAPQGVPATALTIRFLHRTCPAIHSPSRILCEQRDRSSLETPQNPGCYAPEGHIGRTNVEYSFRSVSTRKRKPGHRPFFTLRGETRPELHRRRFGSFRQPPLSARVKASGRLPAPHRDRRRRHAGRLSQGLRRARNRSATAR